ncbi:MAG: hypothetical protein JSW14_00065 [Candidatus Bathyarchaeum sp.]|nr:MAG: hypothetical protein JSW14_00065 [Candidatus Bathyarchaeum sp.]
MKKSASVLLLLLILSSILLTLSYTTQITVRGAEHVFFEDDFESYDVGTFPSSGGWELWFSGAGESYQTIVDSVADSPTKSLQLRGRSSLNPISTNSQTNFQLINFIPPGISNYGACAAWPFETESPRIGFNVSVRVEEIGVGEGPRDTARVSFAKPLDSGRARHYAPVFFCDNGSIAVWGKSVQSYVADRWYRVMLIIDRPSETYSAWIDDVLVAENYTVMNSQSRDILYPTSEIEAFTVAQYYNGVKAYFDDVKVFSVFDLDPKLELEPKSGIAQTTLVGSGFAPDSRITVTWNGNEIHTLPNPLMTNVHGDFTAIITVQNQTDLGNYAVRAVDEMGNEATATFAVIPEFPSWIILPLFLIGTLVVAIIKRKAFRPT